MRTIKLAIASLFLFTPFVASPAPVLDQAFEPGFGIHARIGTLSSGSSSFDIYQSFTVGLNGLLDSIEVAVDKGGSPTENLVLELIGSHDPSGAALYSSVLTPSDVPSAPAFVSFDVSAAGLLVAAGDLLSFRVSSAQDFTANVNEYVGYGSGSGGYSGGVGDHVFNGVAQNRGWDFAFRSYVDTAASSVPEPGALALLGIGLFGLGLARRPRRA